MKGSFCLTFRRLWACRFVVEKVFKTEISISKCATIGDSNAIALSGWDVTNVPMGLTRQSRTSSIESFPRFGFGGPFTQIVRSRLIRTSIYGVTISTEYGGRFQKFSPPSHQAAKILAVLEQYLVQGEIFPSSALSRQGLLLPLSVNYRFLPYHGVCIPFASITA